MKKLLLLLFVSVTCFSQNQKADSFYFDPTVGPGFAKIKANNVNYSTGEVINSKIQEKIDAFTTNGGVIKIKSGTYKIASGIVLKSNVHIKVEAGVIFELDGDGTIFSAQSGSETPLTNFSLVGLGTDNTATGGTDDRFVIKFKYENVSSDTKKSAVIRIGNAANFKLSNFKIIDQYTQPSSIALSAEFSTKTMYPNAKDPNDPTKSIAGKSKLINKVYGVPNKGIIENITNENGAYGYGLVQMQAGENIVYRNLSGSGGVILRLESGLNLTQLFRPLNSLPTYIKDNSSASGYKVRPSSGSGSNITEGLPLTIDNQPKINKVFATNISCKNGHAAFTMSPHTINQGFVSLINITSKSCEFTGEISDGFINNFSREVSAGLDIDSFQILPGSYASNSVVRNVKGTFGQNAQLKSKNFDLIPCSLRIDKGEIAGDPNFGVAVNKGLDFESYRGPSLATIDYGSVHGNVINGVDYSYSINFDESTVTANGFGGTVPANGVISGPENDFETCNSIGKFSQTPFIPNKDKNTPNPLNPDEGGTPLTLSKITSDDYIISPNPTNSFVQIDLKNEDLKIVNINIYNNLGSLVKNIKVDKTLKLDLSGLLPGVYYLNINDGESTTHKKLIKI
ncbi:T9SS type A sorting domain-containing protein [Wenyingzhuangia aestuarii]|uniref:T9SS type A sorting domain-containing protein n=1 Tax=Wenyingzhuangia aestuarii TaxID=1647582 RepID=UPI00143AB8BB|nr:T9SS type A sorting domain-containing protein [Wenyingzhuangia aestuarii]NJB82187.1 hypothetical protein [Wenyingzhuangia aestuarii]